MPTLEDFVDPKTLAQALKISSKLLLDWRGLGMPFIKVRSKAFYHVDSVAEWLVSVQRVEAVENKERRATNQPANGQDRADSSWFSHPSP